MIKLHYDGAYRLEDIIMFDKSSETHYEYVGTYTVEKCKPRKNVTYKKAVQLSLWEYIMRIRNNIKW